jgi:hypothetical protein
LNGAGTLKLADAMSDESKLTTEYKSLLFRAVLASTRLLGMILLP